MEDFSYALIWLGFFASIFLGWYFYIQARNKERMALIEKNADVTEIFKVRKGGFHFPWLKIGMMITGTGVGLILAFLATQNVKPEAWGDVEAMITTGCTLTFGGVGLVLAYFIDKPKGN